MSDNQLQAVTSSAPQLILDKAISSGANIETLERLLDMQIKYDALQAKKEYVRAMAEFKKNPPPIIKNKRADFNARGSNVGYSYADLANVTDSINKELSNHGLSASWETKQESNVIFVTCKITHIDGHSEQTTLSSQADNSGAKNSIQAMGSAISYLQRYTLLSLTGLSTKDQDDDGHGSEPIQYISKTQVDEINKLVEDTGTDAGKFLAYMKVNYYKEIPVSQYNKAIALLNQKKKKNGNSK